MIKFSRSFSTRFSALRLVVTCFRIVGGEHDTHLLLVGEREEEVDGLALGLLKTLSARGGSV